MRRRWVIIAVPVVLVAAVLVGGRAWVRGQDYLEAGGLSRLPQGARVTNAQAVPPSDPDSVAVVPYRDGAQVVYGLSLRNDGPLSVKVTEVARGEAPGDSSSLFRPTGTLMSERENLQARPRAPFRPFTLEPGHERYVEIVGMLGDCEYYEPGSAEVIDRQRVRFEVLGQSLIADVRLPARIEWRYGDGARCPRERAP